MLQHTLNLCFSGSHCLHSVSMRKKINRYDWSGKKTELTKKETLLYTFAFFVGFNTVHMASP